MNQRHKKTGVHRRVLLIATTITLLAISLPTYSANTINNIRVGKHPHKTRIVIDTEQKPQYKITTQTNPNLLIVELTNTKLNFNPNNLSIKNPFIKKVKGKIEQEKNYKLTFSLTQPVIQANNPYPPNNLYGHRLVIDILPKHRTKKLPTKTTKTKTPPQKTPQQTAITITKPKLLPSHTQSTCKEIIEKTNTSNIASNFMNVANVVISSFLPTNNDIDYTAAAQIETPENIEPYKWYNGETLQTALKRWGQKTGYCNIEWAVNDKNGAIIDFPIISNHTFSKNFNESIEQVKQAYAVAEQNPIYLNFIEDNDNKTLTIKNIIK